LAKVELLAPTFLVLLFALRGPDFFGIPTPIIVGIKSKVFLLQRR